MTKKVAILGAGAPDFGQALTIAQEVQRVEISNRRKLMDGVIVHHNEQQLFKKYMKLTHKELKKHSKGFNFIMRYIEGLGLERYYGTRNSRSPQIKHIVLRSCLTHLSIAKSLPNLILKSLIQITSIC